MLPETGEKGNKPLSRRAKTFLLAGIVVLVGVAAFGLGRLSALEEHRTELKIHHPEGS